MNNLVLKLQFNERATLLKDGRSTYGLSIDNRFGIH